MIQKILLLCVLIVITRGIIFRTDPISRCVNLSGSQKKYCWDHAIRELTKHQGIDSALGTIQIWSNKDPDIQKNCHDLLHSIGQEAYFLYKKGGWIKLTQNYQLCAFGFYHGIMENFIQHKEPVALAGSWCDSQNKALVGSCYHGIGHGSVLLYRQDAGSQPWNLINTGIALCQKATDTPIKLQNCVNGLIDGLASAFVRGEFPLTESMRADPLQICRNINQIHQAACYTGLDWLMLHIAGNDFVKTAAFIETIDQDTYATSSVHELAGLYVFVRSDQVSVDAAIVSCQSFQERLRLPCITGLASGLFWHVGLPDQEYQPMLLFCQNKMLHSDETEACFDQMQKTIHMRYSQKQRKQICRLLPLEQRSMCEE
ncbi:hypothetical protein HY086_04035 [Candidatus Gottesmanbacteria bacterium]|nr:hypothetical protein [Candidatus Gottesmanbacteria bacterium]